MKKLFMSALLLAIVFAAGCTDKSQTASVSTQTSELSKTVSAPASTADSNLYSKPAVPLQSSSSAPSLAEENFKISKESAVQIAFAEAQKHQEKFRVILTEDALSNCTAELTEKDGTVYYFVLFKDLQLKHSSHELRTQISVNVDAASGKVLYVGQYK